MKQVLFPFVYWAQTEKDIVFKVDLKEVKDCKINIEQKKIEFAAKGCGAQGFFNYAFSLNLYSDIDPEKSFYKISETKVNFQLNKIDSKLWWPRLICQPQKPAWLKIDFDKWKTSDLDDFDELDKRNVFEDYPGMLEKLQREEIGYTKENLKKVYLFIYYLFQFCGFLYILTVLGVRYYRSGQESIQETYEVVGNAIKFLNLLQYLEVMHAFFRYTKANILGVVYHLFMRTFIIFIMIESEPRMQTKPVVFYLFVVWAIIDFVRYAYNMTQIYEKNIELLTWLQFTIWIPLYPLRLLFEGVIILRNIPYFEETERFTVKLPNSLNFAFHFPTALRLYLLFLLIPSLYVIMVEMLKIRRVALIENKHSKRLKAH